MRRSVGRVRASGLELSGPIVLRVGGRRIRRRQRALLANWAACDAFPALLIPRSEEHDQESRADHAVGSDVGDKNTVGDHGWRELIHNGSSYPVLNSP